ncbi:hypothetical protein MLD38_003595 [Melastoma candidum]|uniref:Uncharacterized protein n=1 Tax=Melastoma candidum TaxID=119954 RepID=A0ACB9S2Y6_9MYRT|nr:hypothetical protein MLD38_003595 [Melastoma candidum]
MSRCRFRLADMMPNTWFRRFKLVSSRRKHDPSSSSLHRRHSNGPILVTQNFDWRRRSYGGRSGRRRSVHRASTSLRRRVASSSNQGHHSSAAPGLIPPVTGTEASTNNADLTPAEMDSGRYSVEIEYMDNGEANIADKEESCEIEHMDGRTSSRGNKGVKLWQNTPVIGKTKKSRARIWRRFSSTLPTTSRVTVRFANENIGESLAMVKSSYNPRRDFRESMSEMITKNKFRTHKDLEDLLAGYLSLNSTDTHSDIIGAFEEIRTKISVLML